jgi:class 3 adenylate cyclase/CheY-like chemotaxis protein
LNQVNHIVGYGELLLEEAEEGLETAPLAGGLRDICALGRELMATIGRILDPGSGAEPDYAALDAALEAPLARVTRLVESLGGQVPAEAEAARTLGQIAASARAARAATGDRAGRSAAETVAASPPSDPDGSGQGLVLVVDDDPLNRDVLVRRLERLGYAVRQAENGLVALDVLKNEPIDVMLLDIDMPDLNGYGVLEARRSEPALAAVPTIMISAAADTDNVIRCISMGAEDHLGKPFDPVLLRARVEACLEKKRLRDQERELLATVSRQAEELAEWNRTLERRVADQVDEIERMARLRRFLSPQLADVVVASGDGSTGLETHRRDIAVLFIDLSGFTAFSETSEPEDVMAVLKEFHDEVGRLVAEFQATVGFFAGDGLMVFFNDPLPCPDPAERAVRMAVATRERVGILAQGWRKRGYDLGLAMGVSSGYATMGQIGFEGRYDYGVIGSVVNLAARLCDRATRNQIFISARAKLAVEDLAELEEVGEVALKGFHHEIAAYNVVGIRDTVGSPQ